MILPNPVMLYDQPRAPNPRRVNIFLAEKGIELPRTVFDLVAGDHRDPEFVAKTGAATIPALELSDGTMLTETQAICRYLEALHPEPNLMGRDAREVAVIEMWQRRLELGLFIAVAQTFRHSNPKMAVMEPVQIAEWADLNRQRLDGHLRALDARLEGRDWIAADRLSVADITAFVAFDFRRIIRHPTPEGCDRLDAWAARMAERPSTQF